MGRGFHFNEDVVWMPRFGIHYHVAIDGISLWLVMLTVFITPIATYASFGSIHTRLKDWCFALLLLEAAMIGAFLALDLFLFYVFWELMLIPMYLMIGVWGGSGRIYSAVKFFLYTFFGSVLMLGAILYVAYAYARVNGGVPSFDYFELQRLLLPRHVQIWLWAAFTLAFVIKVPMFPVHTWLPDAHTEAPTAGSVILAAVMLKMGTYGYLRFSIGLFPEASAEFGANLAGVAVLGGIIYGALCAWKQNDVKRLIAYSSVAHLGYVMLGLFALTQASLEGSVLQMVNHGISTGMLFLLFGVIYDRRHTRQLDEFGGPGEADAGLRDALRHRDARQRRPARHQRLHRRVHGHHGHLRLALPRALQRRAGRGRRGRRHPRRHLHADGRAEDVLRAGHAQGERRPLGRERARARRARPARHDDLRHRLLPQHLPLADQGRGVPRARATSRRGS